MFATNEGLHPSASSQSPDTRQDRRSGCLTMRSLVAGEDSAVAAWKVSGGRAVLNDVGKRQEMS